MFVSFCLQPGGRVELHTVEDGRRVFARICYLCDFIAAFEIRRENQVA